MLALMDFIIYIFNAILELVKIAIIGFLAIVGAFILFFLYSKLLGWSVDNLKATINIIEHHPDQITWWIFAKFFFSIISSITILAPFLMALPEYPRGRVIVYHR